MTRRFQMLGKRFAKPIIDSTKKTESFGSRLISRILNPLGSRGAGGREVFGPPAPTRKQSWARAINEHVQRLFRKPEVLGPPLPPGFKRPKPPKTPRPKPDPKDDDKWLKGLSKKLHGVAKGFGKALSFVGKATAAGFALEFLTKMLNPLEKIEEKLKGLLERGSSTQELADKYGTTPAMIEKLEAVGESLGLSRERLREMMATFAKNLDTAKKEWRDPFAEKSETSRALKKYLDEEDYGQAFLKAIQGSVQLGEGSDDVVAFGLKAQRAVAKAIAAGRLATTEQRLADEPGTVRSFPEELKKYLKTGEIQFRSPERRRAETEEAIFGSELTGAARRFADGDFVQQLTRLGIAGEKLEETFTKLKGINEVNDLLKAKVNVDDLLRSTKASGIDAVVAMQQAQNRQNTRDAGDLAQIGDYQKASQSIEKIGEYLKVISENVTKAIGYLLEFLPALRELKEFTGFAKRLPIATRQSTGSDR